MPKLTLAEKIEARRLTAIKATDKEIANFIWRKIQSIFESFDRFELECLDLIQVIVTEKVDFLSFKVMTRETDSFALLERIEREDVLCLTIQKLEIMEEIMKNVINKAFEEGVEVWRGEDDDGYNYWEFCI